MTTADVDDPEVAAETLLARQAERDDEAWRAIPPDALAVHKTARWEHTVEEDPDDAVEAWRFAIRGLIRRCEDLNVAPVGRLVITDRAPVLDDGSRRTHDYDLCLVLAAPPAGRVRPALMLECPHSACRAGRVGTRATRWRAVYAAEGPTAGSERVEAEAALRKHWQSFHGDPGWEE